MTAFILFPYVSDRPSVEYDRMNDRYGRDSFQLSPPVLGVIFGKCPLSLSADILSDNF
jgi:hypothetical protein